MDHRKFNQKKGAESLCTGFSAFLPAKGKELRGVRSGSGRGCQIGIKMSKPRILEKEVTSPLSMHEIFFINKANVENSFSHKKCLHCFRGT